MSAEEFAENREFLDSMRNASVEEVVRKIVEQHGHEVAKGFLIAMAYVQPKVGDAYCRYVEGHWTGDDHFNINSYTVMTEKMGDVVSHINDLLQTGSTLTGYPGQPYLDSVKVPHKKLRS